MKKELSVIEKGIIAIFVIALIASIVIYVVSFYSMEFASCPEDFGIFGDYAGGVIGTLTGLISIVFLYRTYRIQIEISRVQESQQQSSQFEITFFTLLSQQRSILLQISGELTNSYGKKKTYKGHTYIGMLRRDLEIRLSDLVYEERLISEDNKNDLKVKVNFLYYDLFQSHASQLGHYFRHLYHIMKFVDDSCELNKKKYIDLIQAQMNADELYLTAINGISNYGRKRMLPLLDKYSFLENLIIDDFEVSKLVAIFYPNTRTKTLKNNMKNIVFVGGVHGVGKSHFSKNIKKQIPAIELLSCSGVLHWVDSTQKEVDDVVANQDRLINNLRKIVDIDKPYLLDGHFCLTNADGKIESIPIETFKAIDPEFIVLLEEDIEVVCKRLCNRDRKTYDYDFLTQMALFEYNRAFEVAQELGVPIYVIRSSEFEQMLDPLRSFVHTFVV
ncbi:putative phage abortive infection protein [Bacteroides acidifaciens]|uniref:putative phage abortive infection protein n=1 Tax=Bacteroides acidifaciens TaxID=85831 RepID=UPI00259B639B|nr:putative phage abortive infection protein [Bacteroides acidifaciens]